jgi:hypothetical protein
MGQLGPCRDGADLIPRLTHHRRRYIAEDLGFWSGSQMLFAIEVSGSEK